MVWTQSLQFESGSPLDELYWMATADGIDGFFARLLSGRQLSTAVYHLPRRVIPCRYPHLRTTRGNHGRTFPLGRSVPVFVAELAGLDPASHWEELIAAGEKAYQQARYAEAEQQFKPALKEAETFGPEDRRLATSLNNLAELYNLEALYYTQGKYAQAEPRYKRALAIWDKALGPEHPNVAASLENRAACTRSRAATIISPGLAPIL